MPKKSTKKELVSLSFFSGCLGLDLGLERAGIHQVLACDFDKHCRNSIAINRPDVPVIDDINLYEASDIRKIAGLRANQRPTLIVGGPPCQAFSTAGNRLSFKDPRGNVFLKYIDLINQLQPDFAVIENVRGLLSAPLKHRPHNQRGADFPPLDQEERPGGALFYVVRLLESYGYAVSFNLYNSANYGVPQVRERVILIAARDGKKVPFLKPTHSSDAQFGLPKWVTFKEAVKGLKEKDMISTNFPEDRLKYYRMLGPGQYWKNLPSIELQMEALGNSFHSGGGKTGFFRRLAWNKPSPTLVTHPAMPATDLAHPEKDRPLSIQEYKRVQMFPDDWHLSGGLIQQYKQVGNAVPVGLGEAVGRAIIDHINKSDWNPTSLSGFPYSRYKATDDVAWMKNFEKQNEQSNQTSFSF